MHVPLGAKNGKQTYVTLLHDPPSRMQRLRTALAWSKSHSQPPLPSSSCRTSFRLDKWRYLGTTMEANTFRTTRLSCTAAGKPIDEMRRCLQNEWGVHDCRFFFGGAYHFPLFFTQPHALCTLPSKSIYSYSDPVSHGLVLICCSLRIWLMNLPI